MSVRILVCTAIFFLLLSAYSCNEKKAETFEELSEDVVFTDSFSPINWENPISRGLVQSGDSDMGVFIKDDVTEPRKRRLMNMVNDFIQKLSLNKVNEIKEYLTDAAYNSFILRYSDISFNPNFTVRVGELPLYDDEIEEDDEDYDDEELVDKEDNWIKFKVLFRDRSYIGSFEIVEENGTFKIADFENDIFDELSSHK